eukprot:TRINITY_DN2878_c1_g1_i1.p4 TRINITY_DN2878_c1_g1~~TRINITY_DN2878_c1_g1_i1.p4  ORF type:complete len:133 (-),score=29.22 TRINITY_DN2878_c1_g1_i1:97-459(-)
MSVQCAHLLVKHKDSRRPSSWKEAQVTRTKEEAQAMIAAFEQQLRHPTGPEAGLPLGRRFALLASKESHCSSAQKGGDLGMFSAGMMQAQFEKAAFQLQVGEMSGPVVSDSGVHLIYRIA